MTLFTDRMHAGSFRDWGPKTAQGRRLASKHRVDHPHAAEETCEILREHPEHPYGAIHPGGGLRWWCPGYPAGGTP